MLNFARRNAENAATKRQQKEIRYIYKYIGYLFYGAYNSFYIIQEITQSLLFYFISTKKGDIMYKFIKIDDDTTELKYKEKTFTFKKDVELLSNVQNINFRAKARMMSELKKMNMSADDLVLVKVEGNKRYEDKSNLIELEQYCLGVETELIYDEILKKFCGMTLAQIIVDIGIDITNKDDIVQFTNKVNKAIVGKTESPSEEK